MTEKKKNCGCGCDLLPKKNIENPDKLILKAAFIPETGFSMQDKTFAVNVGNYSIPLRVANYKKDGQIVVFANTPIAKEDLTIKGKAKINNKGVLSILVKVKNADLVEVLGIKNETSESSQEFLPMEIVIGEGIGHSVLPMSLKGKEGGKSNLKLHK